MHIWHKLFNNPSVCWTQKGLSAVASRVGIPLHTDKATTKSPILQYTRICIEMKLRTHIMRSLRLKWSMLEYPRNVWIVGFFLFLFFWAIEWDVWSYLRKMSEGWGPYETHRAVQRNETDKTDTNVTQSAKQLGETSDIKVFNQFE